MAGEIKKTAWFGNISINVYGPWTKDNTRTCETKAYRVDLEIDVRGVLEDLGTRAANNKSKRSSDLGGLVVARVRPL